MGITVAKSKEEIIEIYKNIYEENDKKTPTDKMCKEAGITKHDFDVALGGSPLKKLAEICGYTDNTWSNEKSDLDVIVKEYGNLTRKLQKIPAKADWITEKVKPSKNAFKSHGIRWSDLQKLFIESAAKTEEWNDIIKLFLKTSQVPNASEVSSSESQHELSPDIKKNIPSNFHDLIHLSINDKAGLNFERKINSVFVMLGFEVEHYGQGTGKHPDGIALDNVNHYGIMIDAKARGEGYSIGSGDTVFISYIKNHKERLRKKGIEKLYLLVASSGVKTSTEIATKSILKETQVPTSFITAEQLLNVLSFKINNPLSFDLKKLENLLTERGQISDDDINKFFKSSKKN